MGNPLIGPRYQIFSAGQLASSGRLANTLASGALGADQRRAVALVETALVVAREARELEILLQGYREAQSPESRQRYLLQAIRWMRSHGSQIEGALEQMRWRFARRIDRFANTGSLAEQVSMILALSPQPTVQPHADAFVARSGGSQPRTRTPKTGTPKTETPNRTQQLQTLGVPNAKEVAALEVKMGFRLNLNPKAIKARAAELKALFTEVTLPVPQGFFDLPPHQQEALKLIGRAMKLLVTPHRLQNNPYGDVFETLVMGTPALKSLRPYYQRWAGVFDLSRDKADKKGINRHFGFLPGMENVPLSPGVGLYPPGMTLDEFRKSVAKGSPLDQEGRVVFRYGDKWPLDAIPYSRAYAKWLKPAAKLLEEAAVLLEGDRPAVAKYLRVAANAYRKNDFTTLDKAWVQLNDGTLDLDLSAVETYIDGLRHNLAELGAVLHIRNPDAGLELGLLKEAFAPLEDWLPVPGAYKKPPSERIPPPVSAVSNLFGIGSCTTGNYLAVAYNRPNDESIREKVGTRIVLMENVGRAREETPQAKRLAELAIHPRYRHLVTARGGEWWVRLHELAHGHGVEHLIADPQTTSRSAIGEILGSLEELKADVTGMHDAKVLGQWGRLSKELVEEMFVGYIVWCLGKLRRNWTEAHAKGNLVALNFLQERGAILINPKTGMIDFDLEKYFQAASELSGILITIKGDGDKARAEALYAQYGRTLPKGIEHIFKAMKGMPLDVIVHYAFEDFL